jgi:hypothetical protein
MGPIEEKLGRCPLFEGFDVAQLRKLARAGHLKFDASGGLVD